MKKSKKYIAFQTKEELEQYLNSQPLLQRTCHGDWYYKKNHYRLSKYEVESPSFYPKKYKDGWGVYGEFYFLSDAPIILANGRMKWFSESDQKFKR